VVVLVCSEKKKAAAVEITKFSDALCHHPDNKVNQISTSSRLSTSRITRLGLDWVYLG
jgi:hypothetical protein